MGLLDAGNFGKRFRDFGNKEIACRNVFHTILKKFYLLQINVVCGCMGEG